MSLTSDPILQLTLVQGVSNTRTHTHTKTPPIEVLLPRRGTTNNLVSVVSDHIMLVKPLVESVTFQSVVFLK